MDNEPEILPFIRSAPIPIPAYPMSEENRQKIENSYNKRVNIDLNSLSLEQQEALLLQQLRYAERLAQYYHNNSEKNSCYKEKNIYWQKEAARYNENYNNFVKTQSEPVVNPIILVIPMPQAEEKIFSSKPPIVPIK
jgi:hypothetical protein